MNYSSAEIMQYIREEDVKFIRLAFCDVFGKQKNVSCMASELPRIFDCGIGIDASAIAGFGGQIHSDLFLHPDPATIAVLPWRPEHGRVVRMFCNISHPDGTPFAADARHILQQAVKAAAQAGCDFSFGAEFEFYLMQTDDQGNPTKIPFDNAGYMDIAPEDRGENVRREICLTLEEMGIFPEASHHEEGPGQNEIDFRYSDPLSAADNAVTFRSVVNTIAAKNGLYADFSPKPLENYPGNGLHINISARGQLQEDLNRFLIPGFMRRIADMTLFLNPVFDSYARLGRSKAPGYITWSSENRSQLIRIPAAVDEFCRVELRSADPMVNPYLAFALLIYAGLEGIAAQAAPDAPADVNLFSAPAEVLAGYQQLPQSLRQAAKIAASSDFIAAHLPPSIISAYCDR